MATLAFACVLTAAPGTAAAQAESPSAVVMAGNTLTDPSDWPWLTPKPN